MWETKEPKPVKLIIGILAADELSLKTAVEAVGKKFGQIDCTSGVWPFDTTDYYEQQAGENILRQFVSITKLIHPGKLAKIKHRTNKLEKKLAEKLEMDLPRPVNLDPGYIGASKLVLATTKNYSHRMYIGEQMFAEVTLIFAKGGWSPLPYTYPDYRQQKYFDFFNEVRKKLLEQLKS